MRRTQAPAAVDGDPPPGQLGRQLGRVAAPQLGRHRSVERGQRRRSEPGPHELGVGVVAGLAQRPGRRGRWRCGRRSRSAPSGRGRAPAAGTRPSARRGAGDRCGGAPGGRRRAARRAGPAPAAAPTGAAGGCRGRRAARRPRSWRPSRRGGRRPRAAGRDRPPAGGAERGGQPARAAADHEHVDASVISAVVVVDGDQPVPGDQRHVRPWCRRAARTRCDRDERTTVPDGRRSV